MANTFIHSFIFKWFSRFKIVHVIAAFSYSHSHITNVAKYIENQKIHHRRVTFKEEYEKFLQKFGVSYDEKYILKDV